MNKAPRLLKFESELIMPPEVITDMQLHDICSHSVTEVLRHPCGKENIHERQELFSLMKTGDISERMTRLLAELNEYKRLLHSLQTEKTKYKKLYLNLRVLEKYNCIKSMLSSFEGAGMLLSAVAKHYKFQSTLDKDISKIYGLLSDTQSFLLSSMDKLWITPSSDTPTYTDKLTEYSEKLSLLKESGFKNYSADVPNALSTSLYELYQDNFSQIYTILEKYTEMDLESVLSYIPELEFYLGINSLIKRADSYAVKSTMAQISNAPCFEAEALYDVSLLTKKVAAIPNDACFAANEPFFFLTGANGGGKTTYARAIGINLLLFLSGCPVFAKKARIYPFPGLHTHFPSDERFTDIGRLDDEYKRAKAMLEHPGEFPFLIFNETFSGTDDKRGYELLLETTEHIKSRGIFGLFVTHFHEIENTDLPILYAEVDETKQNKRTFRIMRRGNQSSSFAKDILKKYKLDEESLKARLESIWA